MPEGSVQAAGGEKSSHLYFYPAINCKIVKCTTAISLAKVYPLVQQGREVTRVNLIGYQACSLRVGLTPGNVNCTKNPWLSMP